MQQKFKLSGPIHNAEFTVREDHTLAIDFKLKAGGIRTLVFHDFIRKSGNRFFLFHEKTEIQYFIRTPPRPFLNLLQDHHPRGSHACGRSRTG